MTNSPPSKSETFFWQTWSPIGAARAVMIAVHGMGSAASDFAPLGELLSQEGIAVYAPNLRGQGLDPVVRRRGRELDIDRMISDVCTAASEAKRHHPQAPLLFYGESMGALLLIRLLTSERMLFPVEGTVLAVPVVDLAQPTSPLLRTALQIAALCLPWIEVSPQWFVNRERNVPRLSHDPIRQKYFENAPYLIKKFSASFINSMGTLISSANQAAERILHPVLVLGAGEDDFIRVDQLRKWFDRVGSQDKTLEIFPNSYHRLLFDQDQKEVEKTLLNWLKQRL